MPRHDDRRDSARLYVGHLSSRTRSRDLEDLFSRYGRVRDVDMKRDFAFVEFSDPRDAGDARYGLNGREFVGARITVEFAKGGHRGQGGSREYLGRGGPPGSGRCFNCGIEGHWARDCSGGDWNNKCYHCGERGHIERDCQNSPKKLKRERSYSRSPSPQRGRSRSRSFSGSHSYSVECMDRKRSRNPRHSLGSQSRSPPKRERSVERTDRKRSRSPRHSRSPKQNRTSPPPSTGRKHSPTPYGKSPRKRRSPSPRESRSRSPVEENGHSCSPSPIPRDDRSPADDDDDDDQGSRRVVMTEERQ